MNLGLRLSLVACLAAVLFLGWRWVAASEAPGVPDTQGPNAAAQARRWQSSQDCKECHGQQYDEWYGSHHQIAYTNPEVRRLSDNFRIKDCQACHLPRPVAVTGIGKRTLPRQTRPLEGVGCLACHLGADGAILAKQSNAEAPCRPRADAAFASVELCASCHNQHQTTDQWRASSYAKEKVSCNECHMPEGSHVFPGAHDPVMLRKAAEFALDVAGTSLRMTLRNTGAGHNFPTEERHRAVDVEYSFALADGTTTEWKRAFRFRQPYRDEPGENTQLPASAEKILTAEIPAGAAKAQARVWYRLNPYATDDDPASTLLFEREVAVR